MEIEAKYHFCGPYLFSAKLTPKDLKDIYKLCIKDKKKDASRSLAAHIKEEYFIDLRKFHEITKKYYPAYIKGFEKFYNTKAINFNLEVAWVNFMKAGESNPPHIHTGCNLSSVWFIKVPDKLKKENEKYRGTIAKGGPGSLSFICGSSSPMFLDERRFFPEEGEFFIFPYNLKHYVSPFLSKCERVSVAANFTIDVTAEEKYQGYFGNYKK
jgi:hypothetical protein|tara:strand:+ start:3173 stop:3808 length:636 start_codon:yes stop_codon:yes gene_type:complete